MVQNCKIASGTTPLLYIDILVGPKSLKYILVFENSIIYIDAVPNSLIYISVGPNSLKYSVGFHFTDVQFINCCGQTSLLSHLRDRTLRR